MAQAGVEAGVGDVLGLTSAVRAVKNTRKVTKADMPRNDALPSIEGQSGDVHRDRRRRGDRAGAGAAAAADPALQPLLVASFPLALLLADSRTPSGGYAHSGGLEAAVAEGMGTDRVPAFMRGRLETVAACEAATCAAATHAATDPDPVATLLRLDREAFARCPSPTLRAASSQLGRALLRTGRQILPESGLVAAYQAASAHTPRPVAAGVLAAAARLEPEQAAAVSLHDDLMIVAAAAAKLLPVDSAVAVGWVAALAQRIGELAAWAALPRAADELPSMSAPLIEQRSLSLTEQTWRLFAS